jgi:hypothetical protein
LRAIRDREFAFQRILAAFQNSQVVTPADLSHHSVASFSRPVYASKKAFIRQRLEAEKPAGGIYWTGIYETGRKNE